MPFNGLINNNAADHTTMPLTKSIQIPYKSTQYSSMTGFAKPGQKALLCFYFLSFVSIVIYSVMITPGVSHFTLMGYCEETHTGVRREGSM